MIVLVALLSLTAPARAAECARRPPAAEIAGALDAAEAAYGALDVDAYARAMDEAALALPCLGEPVAPALAARYHRMQGLRLFLEKDREAAVATFGAARALEPDYAFPEALVPAGHPVRADYAAMDVAARRDERVPEPLEGELRFDGTAGTMRPADRPTVVQLLAPTGDVTASAWVRAGDPLPAYAGKPLPDPDRRRAARIAVGAGAGAAALGSVALYAVGAGAAARFAEDDPNASLDELDALRAQANGAVAGSAVLGLLAAGGAALVVAW